MLGEMRWVMVVTVLIACGGSHSTGIDAHVGNDATADVSVDVPLDAPTAPWTQQAYVKASNTTAAAGIFGEQFGSGIAFSADGNTLAIGAPFEASAATGINGNQNDHSQSGTGAVFVFTRTGPTWTQQAYIKPSNTGGLFGWNVALSADGNTLAVGAFDESSAATGIDGNQADMSAVQSGAVYVFVRSGTTWTQQAYVKASNTAARDLFGASVVLSGDGQTLAVGASFESSAASGIDGNQADDSAPGAGAVYVYTRSGPTWSQQAYVKASNPDGTTTMGQCGDCFGASVALSNDGSTLAVGAPGEASGATGINGNQADNSAHEAGAVYVFVRSGTVWTQQVYLKASNTDAVDQFGRVALSGDGNTVAVGALDEASSASGIDGNQGDNSLFGAGAVYVFIRTSGVWSQEAYVKPLGPLQDAKFANVALSSDGSLLAVGAPGVGAIYTFTRGTAWMPQTYVVASNMNTSDHFGVVALSGDGSTLAGGAPDEASAATGIDGDQADNSAPHAGAVYVFAAH